MTLKIPVAVHIYWWLILDCTTTGYVVMEFVLWCTSAGRWNTVHRFGCGWALCTRMVLFHKSGSSISCHLWITYRWITSCTRLCSDQIKYHKNSTLVIGKFGCLINVPEILVGCLGGSVMKVDLYGEVEKKSTSGFGLQVMIRGYLCV